MFSCGSALKTRASIASNALWFTEISSSAVNFSRLTLLCYWSVASLCLNCSKRISIYIFVSRRCFSASTSVERISLHGTGSLGAQRHDCSKRLSTCSALTSRRTSGIAGNVQPYMRQILRKCLSNAIVPNALLHRHAI